MRNQVTPIRQGMRTDIWRLKIPGLRGRRVVDDSPRGPTLFYILFLLDSENGYQDKVMHDPLSAIMVTDFISEHRRLK